jgi:sugar lactone lactonase YvrE
MSGEGVYDAFDQLIAKVIETFDARKQIDRRPLSLKLERHRTPTSVLSFPGKVLADEKSRRLFIADSNHNRIVVVSLDDSSVLEVIGSGEIGLSDGDYTTATFNHPQGMALDGDTLFVADTENHALRSVDLAKRNVTTIAGTGKQSRQHVTFGGQGKQVALNSPWDLTVHGGMLYIAMAGPHQLWKMNPKTGGITPYAGSGREGRIDGRLAEAALAQPSGLTTDGKRLYFADSEVSAIRSADLDPNGEVRTIVGEDLFEFGDRDGKGTEVRLQHPLGVVFHDGWLYITDTYNNKIKRVSPNNQTSETFAGTGHGDLRDGKTAAFDEPAGISYAAGKLYVADTNNHVIRTVDLKTRQVDTLMLKGMEKLVSRSRGSKFNGEIIELPAQSVEPGAASLTVQLDLPAGYKLNPLAPSAIGVSIDPNQAGDVFRNPKLPITVPVKIESDTNLRVDFTLYYCESEKETVCYFKEARLNIPIVVRKGAGSSKLQAAYKLRIQA